MGKIGDVIIFLRRSFMEGKPKFEIGTIKDRLEAAKIHHRAGNLRVAEEEYRKILEEEPYNAEATHLLGLLAMQTGKLEIAEHLFNTAIELEGEKAEVIANLGVVYYLRGNFERAKEHWEKALEIDPEYMEVYANMGKLFAEENQLEKAREYLVKAVNLGDSDESTLITLAEVNLRLKKYNRAELLCKQIFEMGIDNNQVYEILVEALLKQNRAMEAVPFLEIILRRDKENQRYKDMLKELYEQTGFSEN